MGPLRNKSGQIVTAVVHLRSMANNPTPEGHDRLLPLNAQDSIRGICMRIPSRQSLAWAVETPMSRTALVAPQLYQTLGVVPSVRIDESALHQAGNALHTHARGSSAALSGVRLRIRSGRLWPRSPGSNGRIARIADCIAASDAPQTATPQGRCIRARLVEFAIVGDVKGAGWLHYDRAGGQAIQRRSLRFARFAHASIASSEVHSARDGRASSVSLEFV